MPYLSDLIPELPERTANDAEGRTWYQLDPDVVYPWVLDRIAEALAGAQVAPTIRDLYLERARALPPRAWALALQPRDEVADPADLAIRGEALELARSWALELHHAAIGYAAGRAIHIVRRLGWKI